METLFLERLDEATGRLDRLRAWPVAVTDLLTARLRELVRTRDTRLEALARSLAERSLYSWLLAVFAGLAFVLALGGSYGVTAYLVSQRARELGIRVALGARSADIMRAVLVGSLGVASTGIIIGLVLSLGTSRLFERLLFGIAPHDPRVLTSTGLVLLVLSALANWWPALRAARVDPLATLRAE